APLRVKSTIPMGPHKMKNMVYKAKVELPWCQRHITSAWRLQSRLEGEVETLKRVNATLQATSEAALVAADQRTEVLQQQVAALQQHMQHVESNMQVKEVNILDLNGVVAREQARDNTAEVEVAAADSELEAALLTTTEKLQQQLQCELEAAATAAAESATLSKDLQAMISEVEVLCNNSREWETTEVENAAIIQRTRKNVEEELGVHRDYVAKMNQQEGMHLAEVIRKEEEITRLKEKMARQAKKMQDKKMQIEAMEEDTREMKASLTHEIRRLEALLTCTKESAADATAAVARVRRELKEEQIEKAHLLGQLIDAKIDIVRERSKVTADFREIIRCLELELTCASNDVASLRDEEDSHFQEESKFLDEAMRSLWGNWSRMEADLRALRRGQLQAIQAATAANGAMSG
ncbi:hypothetical protein Vretifemale_17044, partial [Volvox reticuliferus]